MNVCSKQIQGRKECRNVSEKRRTKKDIAIVAVHLKTF